MRLPTMRRRATFRLKQALRIAAGEAVLKQPKRTGVRWPQLQVQRDHGLPAVVVERGQEQAPLSTAKCDEDVAVLALPSAVAVHGSSAQQR